MTVYESQTVVFARYAAAQVAYHEQVVTRHQIDGVGCCRMCGRVWPCDEVRHSLRMADHFRQWALTDGSERTQEAVLVRTCVRD